MKILNYFLMFIAFKKSKKYLGILFISIVVLVFFNLMLNDFLDLKYSWSFILFKWIVNFMLFICIVFSVFKIFKREKKIDLLTKDKLLSREEWIIKKYKGN